MHRLQDKAATETKETSATRESEEVSSDEDYEILTADQLQRQEESGKITQAQRTMSGPLKVKAALQPDGGWGVRVPKSGGSRCVGRKGAAVTCTPVC